MQIRGNYMILQLLKDLITDVVYPERLLNSVPKKERLTKREAIATPVKKKMIIGALPAHVSEGTVSELIAPKPLTQEEMRNYASHTVVPSKYSTQRLDGRRREQIEVPVSVTRPKWDPREVPHVQQLSYKGWKLLGLLEHKPIGTKVVEAKGEHIPKSYFINPQTCDYCKRDMYRRYTYIIQNMETKKIKQVGSTCVKGFFEGEVS